MARTSNLLRLQQLDLKREEAARRHERVSATLAAGGSIAAARQAAQAAEAALAEIDRQLRLLDLERQTLKDRIAAEETVLYQGATRSPKELQSLQREVAQLRRQLGSLDDRTLERLLARDDALAACQARQREVAELEADWQQTVSSLGREQQSLAATMQRLDAERESLVALVSPADLAVYERLRRSKGGRAVAVIGPEGCADCGMELPRNTRNLALTGDQLVFCPGCGRILHG